MELWRPTAKGWVHNSLTGRYTRTGPIQAIFHAPSRQYPKVADVVAPTNDAKYRMLYRMVRGVAPDEAAGLVALAMQEEMSGERRTGVEPVEVLGSILSIQERLERTVGKPKAFGCR
jgi:hypothetical protein